MPWRGSIFTFANRVLFVGKADETNTHSVHALKLCLAFNGKFSLSIDSKSSRHSAVIIDAQTEHRIDAREPELIVLLYLIPETDESRELQHTYFAKSNVYEIPDKIANGLLSRIGELRDHSKWDCEKDAHKVCEKILEDLIDSPSTSLSKEKVDTQVRDIIEYLYSEIEKQRKEPKFDEKRIKSLAIIEKLKLHKFGYNVRGVLKEEFMGQTGVSLDDYSDMLRLKAALGVFDVDPTVRSVTAAAKAVGFSVSKLEHVFQECLGINPSELKRRGNVFSRCNED